MTAVHCPEKAPFSITVIEASGLPKQVWSCVHHLAGQVAELTCAIANSSGGRPAVVLPIKPLRRCDRWEEPAS